MKTRRTVMKILSGIPLVGSLGRLSTTSTTFKTGAFTVERMKDAGGRTVAFKVMDHLKDGSKIFNRMIKK